LLQIAEGSHVSRAIADAETAFRMLRQEQEKQGEASLLFKLAQPRS